MGRTYASYPKNDLFLTQSTWSKIYHLPPTYCTSYPQTNVGTNHPHLRYTHIMKIKKKNAHIKRILKNVRFINYFCCNNGERILEYNISSVNIFIYKIIDLFIFLSFRSAIFFISRTYNGHSMHHRINEFHLFLCMY